MENLKTLEQNLDAQVVAQILGRDVTRGELSAAFDAVSNRNNWKLAIDAIVDLDDFNLALTRAAVEFFTASIPTFEARVGAALPLCRYRVRAAGYYAAVGA